MKKTKLTRSLMAAVSVVALSAVMYGCVHSGDETPADPMPQIDSDGDGVADEMDAFPNDATESVDTDGDGVGNNADMDDDGDGVADADDGMPLNAMETRDTDGDGIGDNADLDDDGDGVVDADDLFPLDGTETTDLDGDGIGDNSDMDRDGDMVDNADDAFPNNAMESADTDMDGIGDNADPDRDGDGVYNAMDAFPLDASETADADMDGVGDNADMDDDNDGVADAMDAFPNNPMESADSDGDGIGDNADMDRDGDGVDNAMDAFPDDPMESADLDGDGTGDNADMDRDGDGVADAMDAFPDDAMETADADMDGIGDVADLDDDNDGVPDTEDVFPTNAMESADLDGDGTGDNADMDVDGDGVANVADDFPRDPDEFRDSDGDGVGNNADAFPFDKDETVDADGDGIGDNDDPYIVADDRDNDGVTDELDAFPDDPMESADADMDGIGDNEDMDDDGDGIADVYEGSSSLVVLANAQFVPDDPATPAVDENAVARGLIHMEIGEAAIEATNGNSQAAVSVVGYTDVGDTGPSADDTGTRWPFGEDEDGDGVGDGQLTVVVDIGGNNYMTMRGDNPDTEDVTETDHPLNYSAVLGLGDFTEGLDISVDGDDGATPPVVNMRTRILVFTDKVRASEPGVMKAAVTNAAVLVAQVIEDDDNPDGLVGAKFDHDSDANTDPLPGTFSCPMNTACSVTTDSSGNVATITGYTFTSENYPEGQPVSVDLATSEEDDSYLAFGVWMQDDADATDPDARYTVGAFADGGDPVSTLAVEITGTATYEGSAAGVYTAGDSVDYFQGDAELTADFGANDAQGTITGTIDRIMVGGSMMSDVISLNTDDSPDDGNMVAAGTFSGNARMGTATTVDDTTTYTYNGTWGGQFYNGTADDTTTADVNESHVAPDSVAGTFGVTGTDDMGTMDDMDDDVTRSYVGAFGAHMKADDSMNGN